MSEPPKWLTGVEAARLYSEQLRHLRAKPSAAERECEQLRSLLRQVLWHCGDADHDGLGSLISALIEQSHLLDAPLDPWDACRDVDPFTGQPDQHEHGDACEGNCE